MLTQYFETAIPTAIAAGLGALHIKDRMSSINEIEMDDVIDNIKSGAKAVGKFISRKAEDASDAASTAFKSAKNAAQLTKTDLENNAGRGLKLLKRNLIDQPLEDLNDGKPSLLRRAKRWMHNDYDSSVMTAKDSPAVVKYLGKEMANQGGHFAKGLYKSGKRFIEDKID